MGDLMNTYYIYKVTNKLNGKIYIGKTNNIGQRIRQHLTTYKNRDSEFHKAIDDDGFQNFTWEFLEYTCSSEIASDLEKKYILEFNSLIPNGYNVSVGNGGVPEWEAIVCLEKDGTFVKKYNYLSEVVADGINISSVRRCLDCNHKTAKGYLFMRERDYLKYGAKKYCKKESTQKKPIVQCDLNGNKIAEFDSVSSASDETGFERSNISSNLIGSSKTCHGYIFVYKENFPIKNLSSHKHVGKGIKVAQIDKNTGEVLNTFNSIKEAGDSLGVSYKNIQKVIRMPNRTAYGYKWKQI